MIPQSSPCQSSYLNFLWKFIRKLNLGDMLTFLVSVVLVGMSVFMLLQKSSPGRTLHAIQGSQMNGTNMETARVQRKPELQEKKHESFMEEVRIESLKFYKLKQENSSVIQFSSRESINLKESFST